jgi:hypothetical protein
MVKSDVKIDYYADLELPPTADAEEIKKQFRTLGEYILQRLAWTRADARQPSYTILIAIPEENWRSQPSSKLFRLHMKFSAILS